MGEFILSQDSREPDKLPIENLAHYLADKMPVFIQSKQLHIKQFSAGASNLTYQLTSGEQSVILRRPPSGTKAASAHDMVREYNVIKSVGAFYNLSPKPLLLCEDENVIGEKFFIMEQIIGLGIDKNLPVEMSKKQQLKLCENFVIGLSQLHSIDISSKELSQLGKPEGYVERQLEGWQKRFIKAKTDDVGSSDKIYQWLSIHLPKNSGYQSLVHNDYKFDNLILDPDKPENIKGVLDWEMTTLGDPLLDLGCTLAYWVNADDDAGMQAIRMMPTHLDGMMTRQQVFESYCSIRKIKSFDLAPYYVFGLFRLAVIAQQIYYRFYHGQTDNPKFKNFGQLVNILLNKAEQEIA
ncbi:MAG: phosphotransferase family protein [Gammaproteobacteria bacterium]|nr:MAG: phosphotransferase family protein [Gammaproteobacteria bacterium]